MSKPLNILDPAPDPHAVVHVGEPAIRLDPRTYARGLACVHCGLCLPACPTYTQNGNEADSPRGRIQLMLGLADGRAQPTPDAISHLDLCLDCRACETACPSGVVYHELIEEARTKLEPYRRPVDNPAEDWSRRLLDWVFLNVFVHPNRLRAALLPARLMQKLGLYGLMRRLGVFRILPAGLQKMEQMLPPDGPLWPARSPSYVPAMRLGARVEDAARPRARVMLLSGCVGDVMFGHVNRQAARLLAACGAEVMIPPAQGCCGAIPLHSGAPAPAAEMARHNLGVFLARDQPEPDYIVTTIAGCGAMLREYVDLLRDDPDHAATARRFSAKVRDITEVLLELGLPPMAHPVRASVTYHDACHLLHAQKVSAAPRQLLAQVPGLTLKPLPESDMCCGAAGTYNLTQPAMAGALAERKVSHIASTGCDLCVTGNVGCAMHIQSQPSAVRAGLKVVHPVTILHQAVFGVE